jgi:hypothetical protein
MNAFVHLPLQESVAQSGASKHDQWRGYMTVLVVNLGIINSISILTAVICSMRKFDVDRLHNCFCPEVKWMLAIHLQLSTLSALDLDHVHHLSHALVPEMILIICQKGINELQTLCGRFKVVEIIKRCNVVRC